ncbi:hypothetical protein EV363DRAFT_1456816 [Boletus edulis]|nr:hypothetical protein EV363DRAFT_1456816 [Boletus edulis]
MGATAIEDKKPLAIHAIHEGKARDLQAKITALTKDVRSCIEQLQTRIELQIKMEIRHPFLPIIPSLAHTPAQRVHRQLADAQEKLERSQRRASQQTIERLQRGYEMDIEQRDSDKLVEELRKEADDTEAKTAEKRSRAQRDKHNMSVTADQFMD